MKKNVIAAVVFLFILTSSAFAGEKKWDTVKDETALRKIFIKKSNLKDPVSILFRNVKVEITSSEEQKKINSYCGEVNFKNEYGAYIGFHKFVAIQEDGDPGTVAIAGKDPSLFQILAVDICAGSGLELR
ncbi:MAG: hypothetical protein JZU50_01930 [Desulfobulbaceae bacterium]|jgi:hypothetical protein|nr:hypothetical protein [Desulfobulbaceae bacterium]